MTGKLIVWALDWTGVVKRSKRALDEYIIGGIPTNIPLHREIVRDIDFINGNFTTNFLDQKLDGFSEKIKLDIETQKALLSDKESEDDDSLVAAIIGAIKKMKNC